MTTTSRVRDAEQTALRNGVAATVVGADVEVEQSVVRDLRADVAEVEQSALGVARAERLHLKTSAAFALAAREVHARNVSAVFLISPRVHGTVRTVFDMRAAFAFGLGIVLGRAVLKLLRTR